MKVLIVDQDGVALSYALRAHSAGHQVRWFVKPRPANSKDIGKGFKGDTMGDRLKSGGSKFKNLNAVWSAHKLRNELAHNVEHDMVPSQINQAISSLGDAIKDLGVRI